MSNDNILKLNECNKIKIEYKNLVLNTNLTKIDIHNYNYIYYVNSRFSYEVKMILHKYIDENYDSWIRLRNIL